MSKIISDKAEALKLLGEGNLSLENVSIELKADKSVVICAVKIDGEDIWHASDALKGDKEVVMHATSGGNPNPFALECASDELKADKEVVLGAAKINPHAFGYASDALKSNKDVVLEILNSNNQLPGGEAIMHADVSLKANKEVALVAVTSAGGNALENLSQELRADKEVVLASVKKDGGYSFQFASDNLKADKELVMASIKTEENKYTPTKTIDHISEELKNDPQILTLLGIEQDDKSSEVKTNNDSTFGGKLTDPNGKVSLRLTHLANSFYENEDENIFHDIETYYNGDEGQSWRVPVQYAADDWDWDDESVINFEAKSELTETYREFKKMEFLNKEGVWKEVPVEVKNWYFEAEEKAKNN